VYSSFCFWLNNREYTLIFFSSRFYTEDFTLPQAGALAFPEDELI